jgi:hypothetical protein
MRGPVCDPRRFRQGLRRFRDGLSVRQHAAGGDGGLRLAAAFGEPFLDQENVSTHENLVKRA